MFFNLSTIFAWIFTYRYLILFPLVVIEGPIVTVIAGFLISFGKLNFVFTFILIVVADIVGDCIYYSFGRLGRKGFVQRLSQRIGLNTDRVSRLKHHFDHHAGKTLFLGKLSHIVGTPILLIAGLADVPFLKFIWFVFLATIPKSFILLILGFYFGQAYFKINKVMTYASFIGIAFITIAIVFYAIIIKITKRYADTDEKI